MILIFILLFGICFSKNAGEDIISGLISAGELDKNIYPIRGGSMTIVALMSTTLPQAYLLLGFIYGRYLCENNKKLAVILMGSYLIAELVIIAQF